MPPDRHPVRIVSLDLEPIENLALWQTLAGSARLLQVEWTWVRGHQGQPKNEYANDLAVMAVRDQRTSEGIVESGFSEWLEKKRSKRLYPNYDPDEAFTALESRLEGGAPFPLAESG